MEFRFSVDSQGWLLPYLPSVLQPCIQSRISESAQSDQNEKVLHHEVEKETYLEKSKEESKKESNKETRKSVKNS